MQNTFFFPLHKIHKRKINTTYDHIKATNGMLNDAVLQLPQHYLLSKCHTVSQFVHSIISFKAQRKSTSFPVQIFIKLTNTQEHQVQISCTEFHPNDTINMECMDRNSCAPLSKL